MPGFVGVRESGSLFSGRLQIHSLYSTFDARVLVALFICEKELLNTSVTVLCKKGCI